MKPHVGHADRALGSIEDSTRGLYSFFDGRGLVPHLAQASQHYGLRRKLASIEHALTMPYAVHVVTVPFAPPAPQLSPAVL
jgi:hypothetical protein